MALQPAFSDELELSKDSGKCQVSFSRANIGENVLSCQYVCRNRSSQV